MNAPSNALPRPAAPTFTTLVEVAPDAGDRLAVARARLAHLDGVAAGASAGDGVLILRFLAPDLASLRQALIRFLAAYREAPLPRAWSA
jgi:urease accessory protein